MNILGIETTTRWCEISLAHDETYAYLSSDAGYSHSEQIIPLVQKLLQEHEVSVHDLDGIAVSIGPGSFTGVRIGVSVGRAYSQALQIRMAPIVSLDVLAYACLMQLSKADAVMILPMIDALRDEIYTALYDVHDGTIARVSEYALGNVQTMHDALRLANDKGKQLVVYSAATPTFPSSTYKNSAVHFQTHPTMYTGDAVARLGVQMFAAQNTKSWNDTKPVYIRKSEAEVAFEKRHA